VPGGITILCFVLYENLSDNRQPTGLLAIDSPGLASSHCVWYWLNVPLRFRLVYSTDYLASALIDWSYFSILCIRFSSLIIRAHLSYTYEWSLVLSFSSVTHFAQPSEQCRPTVQFAQSSVAQKINRPNVFRPTGFSPSRLSSVSIQISARPHEWHDKSTAALRWWTDLQNFRPRISASVSMRNTNDPKPKLMTPLYSFLSNKWTKLQNFMIFGTLAHTISLLTTKKPSCR